jgi:membrane fusion protein, heavy metal efflux system
MFSKILVWVIVIGGVGALATAAFLRTEDSTPAGEMDAHADEEGDALQPAKGPHGGKLFRDRNFSLEVTIYETGVEPQFRLFVSEDSKPVDPLRVQATATVQRLGATDEVGFKAEADYLIGDKVIYEPHSFAVTVTVTLDGKSRTFTYAQEEGRLEVAAASLASAGITVEAAGRRTLRKVLTLPGEVKIRHDSRVHIVPKVAGVAVEIPRNLGATVKKGDLLLVVESRELAEQRSTFLSARQRLATATATYNREAGLWQQKITAEQDYLEAKQGRAEAEIALRDASQRLRALGLRETDLGSANGAGLTRFEVRAPFDGVLISRHVAYGESVAADTEVFELANITGMEAEIAVPAQDLDQVREGQTVTVRVLGNALAAEGTISFISSVMGEASRAAIAHVEFPNVDKHWREGLFVEADIVLKSAEVPVAVKAAAIQTFRDWQVVFARFGDQFEVRPIELGLRDGDWVEITAGIAAGQAYATDNAFVLKAELGKSGASHDH